MKKLTDDAELSTSADLVAQNLAGIAALFPQAVVEDKVDLSVLRELLGDAVAEQDERFGLSWSGKARARRLALSPSTGTLRPARAESLAWDRTGNLVIEGDNLEVLKLLQKAYAGKVKLIYIDPPYNTGKDFVYPDDYRDSIANYLLRTGQIDGHGARLSTKAETSGRYHTDWLNMLFPRLMLARQLLRDDGVIMVSIDDTEVGAAQQLLRELFGEQNELAVLIWNKQHSQQQGIFKRYHEYVLVFAKRKDRLTNIGGGGGEIDAGALKKISKANPASDYDFPAGVRFDAKDGAELTGTFGRSEQVTVVRGRLLCKRGRTAEPVTLRAGWTQRKQMDSWFAGQQTLDTKGQELLEFYFNGAGKLRSRKARSARTPPSLLPRYGMVSEQTRQLDALMGATVFSNPKPVEMLRDFVSWFTTEGDLVVDFFAGSGTTAHGTWKQVATDGQQRRVFLVQLPEPLDPDRGPQAAAAAYCDQLDKPRTVAELTKERVRRAAAAITAEAGAGTLPPLGFRVFKLDSTNLAPWDPAPTDLRAQLLDQVDRIKAGRSEEDLLYEVLLKLGIDLCAPIETRTLAGHAVHRVAGGRLWACLREELSREDVPPLARGIIQWHREHSSHRSSSGASSATLLFRDAAFQDDVAKQNLVATLELAGLENVRSL